MVLEALESNRIANSMPIGSTDSKLTKFFNLLVLIIDQSINIVIYIVNVKYILVVGILKHLRFRGVRSATPTCQAVLDGRVQVTGSLYRTSSSALVGRNRD